jgi:long-chain-fatty-acid---luciferin-component ligase
MAMITEASCQPEREQVVAGTDPLDAALGIDDLYRLDPAAVETFRVRFTRAAVDHHRARNPHYDRYCDRAKFSSARLEREADLALVPVLPSAIFKRRVELVQSSGTVAPVIHTTSSGTQGTLSVIPRDDVTLMRFFSTVSIGHREVLGIEAFERQFFNLSPSARDAPDLWIAYVMTGVGVIFSTRSYVQHDQLQLDQLLADVRAVRAGEGISIVGPPPLLLDLAIHLEQHGRLSLPSDALVITIGGWKRREGERIVRADFDRRIAAALGIADVSRVRDTYNMVELNTVIFECAHKTKHCPPWLTMIARDPRTHEALPSGQSGVLSFLDVTATSYPGFIVSDDFGVVDRRVACRCGLTTDAVTVERRINRVESRGCALKLDTVSRPQSPRTPVHSDQPATGERR